MIRTRFAPSPTGELHIGGVRTALFAYLFAKHSSGEFLLRIEDTDRERFVEGATERIIESLDWFGIIPDNYHSLVVQSERTELYKKAALDLVAHGHAYVCDCSKERLDDLRKEQETKKLPPRYDRLCRERKLEFGEGRVIRFAMPLQGKLGFDDAVRGHIEFDSALIDDPVILKSDGFPTYHLAAVVDDHEMEISHVIRGEEWLSSTPKHIALYQAFGWQPPIFAHLPVILGPDKKHKLSKRDGDVSVIDFKKKGYLPSALINFISMLGWNPKDEREIFSVAELIKEFALENVNKSPAVFNLEKLGDINEKYIRAHDQNELQNGLREFGLEGASEGEMVLAQRGGYKTLVEVAEEIKQLRQEPEYDPALLVFKKSDKETTLRALQLGREALAKAEIWSVESLQDALVQTININSLTNGDLFWPIRVALSGRDKSPSPLELLLSLGKVESLKRIDKAIKSLEK